MKNGIVLLLCLLVVAPVFAQSGDLPSDEELEEMDRVLCAAPRADYEAALRGA
jgi:hypothetical protein